MADSYSSGGGNVAGGRAVLDDDQGLQQRELVDDGGDARGELAVEDEGFEVGVVAEVAELFLDVAEVDVDGGGGELEGGEGALEVLVAVVEVEADAVAGADALLLEVVGELGGARVEVAEGEAAVGVDDGFAVGDCVGYGFHEVGELVLHYAPPTTTRWLVR